MQRLGPLIDLVSIDSVARPSQYFREFVVAHSAESSRTAPTTENPSFIGSLRIPAQSQILESRHCGSLKFPRYFIFRQNRCQPPSHPLQEVFFVPFQQSYSPRVFGLVASA